MEDHSELTERQSIHHGDSYNIIKKHNGSITVENNSNGGACFTLEIPTKHINIENAK